MPTESYTRITANRIFDSLNIKVDFDTVDKIMIRSRGFCHELIKSMSLFTKMRSQVDQINQILNMNQDIIVELIYKMQASMANEEGENANQEQELNSLREYSEKMVGAIDDIKEKITIQETKYMSQGRESLEQWQKKQYMNAEVLTDVLINSGQKLDESFTKKLAKLLFLEICNEKTFDPANQIYYSVEQVLGSSDKKLDTKVKQITVDLAKTKSQLLQPFQQIMENTANEQAVIAELQQRVRALSSATRDYITQEVSGNPEMMALAGELQDIASDKAQAPSV